MTIIKVQFPKDFEEKYREYRQMFLDILAREKTEKNEELDNAEINIKQQDIDSKEENLHLKIKTAKILLLKENEIKNKVHTFASLDNSFNLPIDGLFALANQDLIQLNNCLLSQGYINEYRRKRKEFEVKQYNIMIASVGSGHSSNPKETDAWKNYLTDKYCNLGKGIYDELTKNFQIETDAFTFQSLAKNDIARAFLSLKVKIYPKRIKDFLDRKIDLFIKDELDLSGKPMEMFSDKFANLYKTQRFLSYEKQKECFAIAIENLTNEQGYPLNNLKIDYTQIWEKEMILQTNFLETALGMEREELIEIKDIIDPIPKNLIVATSDLFWKYPLTIKMKILPDFNKYYELVSKKYNPKDTLKEDKPEPEKTSIKKEDIIDSIESQKDTRNEVIFDYNNVSFSFSGEFYKPTEEVRKKLLRELWKNRQIKNKKGEIVKDGERKRESEIAVLSGFIKSEQEFNFPENKNNFKETIKQLNRIFKDKKFPLTINSNKEGILMIYAKDLG
ncbi:MAG: hypothetical protein AAB340_00285 [Patescibacteria group bacterium]